MTTTVESASLSTEENSVAENEMLSATAGNAAETAEEVIITKNAVPEEEIETQEPIADALWLEDNQSNAQEQSEMPESTSEERTETSTVETATPSVSHSSVNTAKPSENNGNSLECASESPIKTAKPSENNNNESPENSSKSTDHATNLEESAPQSTVKPSAFAKLSLRDRVKVELAKLANQRPKIGGSVGGQMDAMELGQDDMFIDLNTQEERAQLRSRKCPQDDWFAKTILPRVTLGSLKARPAVTEKEVSPSKTVTTHVLNISESGDALERKTLTVAASDDDFFSRPHPDGYKKRLQEKQRLTVAMKTLRQQEKQRRLDLFKQDNELEDDAGDEHLDDEEEEAMTSEEEESEAEASQDDDDEEETVDGGGVDGDNDVVDRPISADSSTDPMILDGKDSRKDQTSDGDEAPTTSNDIVDSAERPTQPPPSSGNKDVLFDLDDEETLNLRLPETFTEDDPPLMNSTMAVDHNNLNNNSCNNNNNIHQQLSINTTDGNSTSQQSAADLFGSQSELGSPITGDASTTGRLDDTELDRLGLPSTLSQLAMEQGTSKSTSGLMDLAGVDLSQSSSTFEMPAMVGGGHGRDSNSQAPDDLAMLASVPFTEMMSSQAAVANNKINNGGRASDHPTISESSTLDTIAENDSDEEDVGVVKTGRRIAGAASRTKAIIDDDDDDEDDAKSTKHVDNMNDDESKENRQLPKRVGELDDSDDNEEQQEEEEHDGSDGDNEEENEEIVENDDESGNEEDDENEEPNGNAVDGGEEDSDDEMAVFRRLEEAEKKRRKKLLSKGGKLRSRFLEQEAELSGSDVGSGDEDETGLDDAYEAMEGDADVLPEGHEDQLLKIHQKVELDQDARQLARLKDKFLADGDLDIDRRKLTWRFRLAGNEDDNDTDVKGLTDFDDNTLAVDDDALLKMAQERMLLAKMRAKKLNSPSKKATATEDSDEDDTSGSQLVKLGRQLSRRTTAPLQLRQSGDTIDDNEGEDLDDLDGCVSVNPSVKRRKPLTSSLLDAPAERLTLVCRSAADSGANSEHINARGLYTAVSPLHKPGTVTKRPPTGTARGGNAAKKSKHDRPVSIFASMD